MSGFNFIDFFIDFNITNKKKYPGIKIIRAEL